MRIDPTYLDRLITATDIVELVSSRVTLVKQGKEWAGRCPFHEESTPSFYVNPQKQLYHCRGCKAGGNVIQFIERHDKIDFRAAVELLAERASMLPLQLEGGVRPGGSTNNRLYAALADATTFFQDQLARHPAAVEYCASRGIGQQAIDRFRLGFAPDSWDALAKALQRHGTDTLTEAGLLIPRENKRHHDRFRNRLMFPISDRRGRVIGFGARRLGDGDGPKYLNSPETVLFRKGEELYGLWQVIEGDRRDPHGRGGPLLAVEGYTDVTSLQTSGAARAVAALGTALSASQIGTMFAREPVVVFCFDGDKAGQAAARRALETMMPLLEDGREARFLLLPASSDPDSLVRDEGPEAFRARVDRAYPLSTYLFEHYLPSIDLDSPEGRARYASALNAQIHRMPAGPYQLALLSELSKRSGIPLPGAGMQAPEPSVQAPTGSTVSALSPALVLGGLLTRRPELADHAPRAHRLASLPLPHAELLAAMVDFIQSRHAPQPGQVLEHFFMSDHRKAVFEAAELVAQMADSEALLDAYVQNMDALVAEGERLANDALKVEADRSGGLECLEADQMASYLDVVSLRKDWDRLRKPIAKPSAAPEAPPPASPAPAERDRRSSRSGKEPGPQVMEQKPTNRGVFL